MTATAATIIVEIVESARTAALASCQSTSPSRAAAMATAVAIRKTVATPRSHSTPLNRSSFFKSPSGGRETRLREARKGLTLILGFNPC